jgi:phosphate transport system protein
MTHLEESLKALRRSLKEMAELVQNQIHKSIASLVEHDEDLAHEVIRNETRVNSFELTIDRQCEQIFALLTPVAHDMRLVFATLKINADLERIGDYAEGISKLVLLGKKQFDPALIKKIELIKMAETTKEMLGQVIKAYCEEDSNIARIVFTRDLELNEINHHATDIAIEYCKMNPDKMHQAMYLLSIIRKLERVGDHITNIAEEIIFFKEAKILKHGNKGEELR